MFRVPMPEVISGWRIGRSVVFAQEAAEPAHALAAGRCGRRRSARPGRARWRCARRRRSCACGWYWRISSHIFLTLKMFGMIEVMPMMSYWCVRISSMKRSSVGKSSSDAGGLDVRLDQHQAPTAMEHPQRERPLRPRDLVVVQLHRVHRPAAVLVVLAVGAEDAGQEDFRFGRAEGHPLPFMVDW